MPDETPKTEEGIPAEKVDPTKRPSKFSSPPIEETPIQPTSSSTDSEPLPPHTPEDEPLSLKTSPPRKPVRSSPFKSLTMLIIATLIAGIGYFGYRLLYSPTPTSSPAPASSEVPTPTPDPKSAWNSHTTSIYKIKYPEDMQASILPENTLVLTQYGPTQADNTEFYDGISLTIKSSSLENESLISYIERRVSEVLSSGGEITSAIQETTIAEYPGYTFTATNLLPFKMIFLQSSPTSQTFIEITDSSLDPGSLGFDATVIEILETVEMMESPENGYACPETEYINCMPVADADPDPRCEQEYLDWALTNCDNFLGPTY